MSSGCGCKEVHVYRFPHITYPYSSSIYLLFFVAASLLFVLFFNVFRSLHKEFTSYYYTTENITGLNSKQIE